MTVFLNCTNHTLTVEQKVDAQDVAIFGATEFQELTDENKRAFGQVPVEPLLDIEEYCAGIVKQYESLPKGSIVMVQGEHTVTVYLVGVAKSLGLIPVAALSIRRTEEAEDGTKTSRFVHAGYRRYR